MARTTSELKLKTIADRASLGACGGEYIANGSYKKQNFGAIMSLDDATVIDFTHATTKTEGDLNSTVDITLKAGVTMFGNFTQVVVKTGGAVVAYKKC